MELYLVLICAGILSGVLTILFGFAGGFVVVPLVYSVIRYHAVVDTLAYQYAFKSAIATSLLLMIMNAGLATYQQHKNGKIRTQYLIPLVYWIAFGAVIGTALSFFISAEILKWIFVIYLLITILDCMTRQVKTSARPMQKKIRLLYKTEQSCGGFLIGAIAAALGVGGSVMTVPLFRRCGLDMRAAVALANPLSVPVAVAGCATYIVGYWVNSIHLGSGFIAYFYYPALICLVLGGFLGMKMGLKFVGKLSNQLHERGYIFLLCLVLISIVLN